MSPYEEDVLPLNYTARSTSCRGCCAHMWTHIGYLNNKSQCQWPHCNQKCWWDLNPHKTALQAARLTNSLTAPQYSREHSACFWDISLDNVSDYSHLDTSPETFVPTTGFEPVPPGLQAGALPIELRRHIDEFHINHIMLKSNESQTSRCFENHSASTCCVITTIAWVQQHVKNFLWKFFLLIWPATMKEIVD